MTKNGPWRVEFCCRSGFVLIVFSPWKRITQDEVKSFYSMWILLPLALLSSWSVRLGVLETMVAGDSLCSNLATRTASELSLLPSLITPWSVSSRMGEEELLSTGPPCVACFSSSGVLVVSAGVEDCCVLATGEGLITGGCSGTVLSGGAALQPSGSARRADLERTRDDPAPPPLLFCGITYVPAPGAVMTAFGDG